jgi:hypothetical protein
MNPERIIPSLEKVSSLVVVSLVVVVLVIWRASAGF